MGVMLNTNYRVWEDGSERVGWPQPTGDRPLWAYERIGRDAREFRQAGFTAILLPPFTKGASGAASDGYDKFDDYDIGSRDQCFSLPTAFGTAEMLRQCVARIHAHQMQAYGDLVLHQYGGGADGVYTPVGADGSARNGRFPKHPSCFVGAPPRVEADPVPDSMGNFAFGDMAAYVGSLPAGYMRDGAIRAAGWLTLTTGVDGWRIDDVKGTNAALVHDLLRSDALRDSWAFGEYFDTATAALSNWINGAMRRRAAVLDFGFKFSVANLCNNNSRVWMGQLASAGYCTIDPGMAVTFVESADTDGTPGEQTVWNKMLGYAIMLTFPGYPSVFYRDWSTDPGCYGLKGPINNLIWIHENLAHGDFVPRLDTDPQVFVHERTGQDGLPGCVCAFNNDQWSAYTRTVQTSFGPNQEMQEYTGNGSYRNIWTDAQGRLTFTVPRNVDGMSYLVFGRPMGDVGFGWRSMPTTQTFFGAIDLDIPPLRDGGFDVGRVWCAAGTRLSATLAAEQAGWSNESALRLDVLGPAADQVPLDFDDPADQGQGVTVQVAATGWHTLRLTGTALPAEGSPFQLRVTYTAGHL
jgi:alpha-amylase